MAFNLFEYIFIYRKNFRQHASCDFNEEGYKIMVELTLKDIEFFKTEGYLVKRNVLDPELMERARARLWEGAPEGRRRDCLLYTSPSPRDRTRSRMPSSA